MKKIQMKQIKSKHYINAQIVREPSKEKHMLSMSQFAQEYSIIKFMQKIIKTQKIKKKIEKLKKKVLIKNQNGKIKVMN